jgi:dephospho-CoA kinase
VLNVGLTGNVASGKSAVARHFAQWGATLIDADRLVREVQCPGLPVAQAIEDRFGANALRPDGTLDRARLRAIVMQDAQARSDLEAIVHPAVHARRQELVTEAHARGDLIVVNDIPLLFEVLDPAAFDLVVLVHAPIELRRHRLTTLRGLAPADADRLIAAQLPSESKRALSHLVIDNDGTLADLEAGCRAAWIEIRRRAAAAATTPGGTIVMVFAHADDAAVLVPGTLRRCAEGGVHVHVVCGAGTWRAGLPAASVTSLGLTAGALSDGAGAGSSPIARLLDDQRPSAVVTFGPDGGNGHPDHVAVHRWTRQAVASCASHPILYYVAGGGAVAMDAGRAGSCAAVLDVRPWLDTSPAAAVACGIAPPPTTQTGPWSGREWFVSDPRTTPPRWDLLARRNSG